MGSQVKALLLKERLFYGVILLMSTWYCHRFFGFSYSWEADAAHHLYSRYFRDLIEGGFNPFQWTYSAYQPFIHNANPISQIIQNLSLWFAGPGVGTSVGMLFVESLVFLFLLQCSFFKWFRITGFKKHEALFASLLCTYTGFHLVGVRQFNHMYLLSYLAVPWWFWSMEEFRQHQKKSALFLSILILGVSLLGASNAPFMFFYLGYGLYLVLGILCKKEKAAWGKTLLVMVGSMGGGVLISAIVLFPSMAYLGETNRALLEVQSATGQFTLFEKISTSMFRNWWRMQGWHHHERDYFIGLFPLFLSLLGLIHRLIETLKSKKIQATDFLMMTLLGLALLMSSLSLFPSPLQSAVEWALAKLSLRYPDRFFLVALWPLAYFAVLGWRVFSPRCNGWLLGFGLISTLWGIAVLFPTLSHLPESVFLTLKIYVLLSLTLFLILALKNRIPTSYHAHLMGVGALLLFLTYLISPSQSTMYLVQFMDNQTHRGPLYGKTVSVAELFGVGGDYSSVVERATKLLKEVPPYLQAIPPGPHKILFQKDITQSQRYHYYAPSHGHRFAFTSVADPASHRLTYQLSKLQNEAVLDFSGVCHVVAFDNHHQPVVKERTTCWEPARFFTNYHCTPDGQSAMDLLERESPASLKQKLILDCGQGMSSSHESQFSGLVPIDATIESGKVEFHFKAPEKGWLFLSIPYTKAWKALNQNQPTPLVQANHAYMAVRAQKGDNAIKLHLDKTWEKRGWWVSWVSLLLFFSLWGGALKKNKAQKRGNLEV